MKKQLDKTQRATLIATLAERFEKNKDRHKGLNWKDVLARLEKESEKLHTLFLMEETGGEPDVIGQDPATGAFLFCDCAPESPAGRRSLCFDLAALNARKENKPKGDAQSAATAMGIDILSEDQYRDLQKLGEFDRKTSSWIATPEAVRKLGGALFGDRRYDRVFTYHNGADSYYAARGFRGLLKV